ncbi:hypothetical protein [Mitsuaria sp. PDC51]|uniref:hypothetical protein n=1 Tax=Mitsuaria sp. PDC51 TaxID=1881035 RepID=UPI001C317000|nr:hypothetical protein [Mitsuaria sp. PDC51]
MSWYFSRFLPTGEVRIPAHWSFVIAPGITSEQYPELIECFKALLASLLANRNQQSYDFSVRSIPAFLIGARAMLRWMATNNIRDFSELTPEVCDAYLADLPSEILHPVNYRPGPQEGRKKVTELREMADIELAYESAGVDEFDEQATPTFDEETGGEDEYVNDDVRDEDGNETVSVEQIDDSIVAQNVAENEENRQPSFNQVYLRISTIHQIYSQRLDFEEFGIPFMLSQPFDGLSAKKVAEPVSRIVREITPPLPDEVALPLLTEALTWLDDKAPDVLRLRDLVLMERTRLAKEHGLRTTKYYTQLNKALRAFEFSVLTGQVSPWREGLESVSMETPTTNPAKLIPVQLGPLRQVRRLILTLRDAAFVLLNYLVGLRISEYKSIRVRNQSGLLFGCVEKRTSRSGILEIFFVKGFITKGRDIPIETEWVIGCRPVGSDFEPIPLRAIRLLHELFLPWKGDCQEYGLFQQFSNMNSLPYDEDLTVDAFSGNLVLGLRRFVHHEVDLTGLPQRGAHGEDLTPYIATRGRCITSHQGRKTFSAFMLDSRRSLLLPVSRHFHHLNTTVTEASYFAAVARLKREVNSETTANTIRVFEEVMDGNVVLVGRMAAAIDAMVNSEAWANASTRRERYIAIKATVLLHELTIYFTRYGMCFIKAKPLESRCNEAAEHTGWLWDEPAFEYRTPALCAGCGCFAIDPSHRTYWVDRADRHIDGDAREFHVLFSQREQARKVVLWLKDAAA